MFDKNVSSVSTAKIYPINPDTLKTKKEGIKGC